MKIPLFPDAASNFAPDVDHLYFYLVAVSVFFTVLIFAAIFILAIKYRRRQGTTAFLATFTPPSWSKLYGR